MPTKKRGNTGKRMICLTRKAFCNIGVFSVRNTIFETDIFVAFKCYIMKTIVDTLYRVFLFSNIFRKVVGFIGLNCSGSSGFFVTNLDYGFSI
jgi:hypothetical protein